MDLLVTAVIALWVGWKARSVHEHTHRVRRDLAEMFGPVPEPPSNVVSIHSSDGDGLIA